MNKKPSIYFAFIAPLFLLIAILYYSIDYSTEKEFISEYENYDFAIFNSTEVYLRGYWNNQKLIALRKYDSIDNELFFKGYIIDSIKNVQYYPSENYNGDTPTASEIRTIREFDSINVRYLRVDKDFNVKMNIDNYESFNFVRVLDSVTFFKTQEPNYYHQIKNNWYVLKSNLSRIKRSD